jgi:hypothetical protein
MRSVRPIPPRRFSYADARALLPTIRSLTSAAQDRLAQLGVQGTEVAMQQAQTVVEDWIRSVTALGVGVKGMWTVDFDTGAGCYCWQHPEPDLVYFYSYEDGFAGRVRVH